MIFCEIYHYIIDAIMKLSVKLILKTKKMLEEKNIFAQNFEIHII